MPPHQLFPYDEFGGVRAPFQLLGEIPGTQDAHNDVTSTNKPSASATISPDEEVEHLCFSDIEDALDDDDDEDGALESNWQRRDVVSRRGIEIFVGGLTRSTRRDMLRDWFQHAGEVTEVRIARDKRRRRCRGYGYVRFATSEQANRAIETMHRFEFKPGRFLGVLPSDENRTLFVGGLKEEWGCDYICKLLKDKMVSTHLQSIRSRTRVLRDWPAPVEGCGMTTMDLCLLGYCPTCTGQLFSHFRILLLKPRS